MAFALSARVRLFGGRDLPLQSCCRRPVRSTSALRRPPSAQLEDGGPDPADAADAVADRRASTEEMLRADMEALRARRQASGDDGPEKRTALRAAQDFVGGVLLWDFFLVVGLLVWLLVALVPHFASQNDVLLDPWLGLWSPFIQPVMGVLMLGTIVQGTISFIADNDK